MRTLALLLALNGCFASSLPEPAPEMPEPTVNIVERTLDTTVALVNESGRSFCAGVFVRGYILTASHCLAEDSDEMLFQIRGNERIFRARVATFSPDSDAAVLSPMDVLPPHAETILSPAEPERGAAVVVVGHPLGHRWFITTGVSNGVRQLDDQFWLLFSAPVMYGNSGGPVFNEFGEVVGIVSWLAWNRSDGVPVPHIAAAVPIEVLKQALSGAQ